MIQQTLSRLKQSGECALVPFVMAGDPSLDQLPMIVAALQEGGADLIEIGLPFSDPIADGPTIQAAGFRALERGTKHSQVLETLAACEPAVPLILMGYLNPMLAMGLREFASAAKRAHVYGVIVCDIIPEEAAEWTEIAQEFGLETIFLAAPTSTDERLDLVSNASTGFVYAVSRTGVTGAGASSPPDVGDLVQRIRRHTDKPICVGFGISSADHVTAVCQFADGAVVGSSLVDLIARAWESGKGKSELVRMVRTLKLATSTTRSN